MEQNNYRSFVAYSANRSENKVVTYGVSRCGILLDHDCNNLSMILAFFVRR